jgi:hypothetical protein
MRLIFNSTLMIAAAGLGIAAGFALRGRIVSGNSASATSARASTAPSISNSASDTSRPALVRGVDDSPLATRLEHDLAMSSGVTRWLYWLQAMEKALPSDFPRLARLAQSDPAALRLVARRWAELYPQHLFHTIMASPASGNTASTAELVRTLFDLWPKSDPEAAITALNGPENFGMRNAFRLQVAITVFDQHVERGLRLMAEWQIENFGPRMTAVAKWAAADPRHAAEFALDNAVGYAAQLTMTTIGEEWAKVDPAGALAFITNKPGELSQDLAVSAMKTWAGQNLREAGNWLVQADAGTLNRLSPAFVEVWAKQDPTGALDWCESNLTGSSLMRAVSGVVTGAASKDCAGAAGLVAAMNPSPARAEAAAAVAKSWFPGLSADDTVKPEAITWLSGLDADSIRRVVEQVQWGWATSDPQTMAKFLAASSSDEIPASAYGILVRRLASKDPLAALDWAAKLPVDRSLSAGGDAFAEWRATQPEAAVEWLHALPASDPRRQAYFESAIRVLAYDPRAAEQLAAMSAAERATARTVIENMTLSGDRRSRLLEALNTP